MGNYLKMRSINKSIEWLTSLLLFFSPMTLFSFDFGGIALYPSFILLASPLITTCKVSKSHVIFFLSAMSFYLIAVLSKPYLSGDVIKIISMLALYIYIENHVPRKQLLTVMDLSITVMVFYSLFQYLSVVSGYEQQATWLHELIGFEGFGGPIDNRSNILRVSSLTKEPSYFAFTVGVYFFLTKSKVVKFFCIIGIMLSSSLISLYALSALFLYSILNYYFSFPLFPYLIILTLVQIFIGINFSLLYDYVPPDVIGTFEVRYFGLIEFVKSKDLFDLLLGLRDYPNLVSNIYLQRPFSNLSSIAVNFGLLGLIAYSFFLASLGKKNRIATISIFLYGFNFYYLTGWPIFPVFLLMTSPYFNNQKNIDSQDKLLKTS